MAYVGREEGGESECINEERGCSTTGRQKSMIRDHEDSGYAANELQGESFTNVAKRQQYTFVNRPRRARGVSPVQK